MGNVDGAAPANSPLIDYALKGLDRCWFPEYGRWSHIYHLDRHETPNESVPYSDVFYTLNVLLGMSRVPSVPRSIDVPAIFRRNVPLLLTLPVSKYAFGVTLWAAAQLQLELPGDVVRHVDALMADKGKWPTFRAQDLGMMLCGVAAQGRIDGKRWSSAASELFAFLVDKYHSESDLFYDAAQGARRLYATFASQTYLTLACYAYGELSGDRRAIDMANRCTRKLIASQGPNGEWPWYFDPARGLVTDFYEVYSVHQYGMAPAFLECAERHDVPEARAAIVKGFRWVFGENQLGVPMLVPELSLTIRSQMRKGGRYAKERRVLRALQTSVLRRPAVPAEPTDLELRRECRSYELGWILWSFGQRSDLPELTGNPMFQAPNPG
jgi:hypothetical protein